MADMRACGLPYGCPVPPMDTFVFTSVILLGEFNDCHLQSASCRACCRHQQYHLVPKVLMTLVRPVPTFCWTLGYAHIEPLVSQTSDCLQTMLICCVKTPLILEKVHKLTGVARLVVQL